MPAPADEKRFTAYYRSEIGMIEVVGTGKGILSVNFKEKRPSRIPETDTFPPVIKECLRQLDEYFRGRRTSFSLELSLRGTDFQQKVWRRLLKIPYGATLSYKDVAKAVGHPRSTRAVGGANHKNAIGIIVPCHRVIGHDGKLVGYGGGLWRKEWLLQHESRFSRR
jgi:methylated-DNA-[protein]-cysteine S-methyltransferase